MCDKATHNFGCDCNCSYSRATPTVDWSKPVMFENYPDTKIRVICTDRSGPTGPIVILRNHDGGEELRSYNENGTSRYYGDRIVNRPEYRYKNVYTGMGSTSEHSSLDEAIKTGSVTVPSDYRGNKAICVIQFVPGDNSSAKIVHTY